jgi:hypothetical protein
MMTEVIHIDKKKAKALLKAAVEKRGPETVVNSCSYTEYHGDSEELSPSCLVGEALFIAGLPVSQLEIIDTILGNIKEYNPLRTDEYGFSLTAGALHVFDTAQTIQDGRECDDRSWANALDHALAV